MLILTQQYVIAGEIECTKHHFLDTTVKQFTSETPVAHTPAPSPPAPAAADDSTSRDSQMAADNERMQRELLCLQASLGALFVTCHTLTEVRHDTASCHSFAAARSAQ